MNAGADGLHQRVVELLRDAAATIVVPRFRKLAEGDIRAKTHPGDLVTIADEEAERFLSGELTKLVPGSCAVGEESASKDGAVLNLLSGPDPVWILDPVDGTANFVNGIDRFAMMVALVQGGETVMGWIHNPLTGETLWAEKGAGAAVQAPNDSVTLQRIAPPTKPLSEMTVAMHHKAFGPHLGKFKRNLRLGSAAHDYWSLVDGRADLLSYRRLRPWDHAAGVLIHAEACGYGRLLTGQPYPPLPDQEGLLCAPSPAVWEEVTALLKG